MGKYKWNLGIGDFCGLGVKREDYHSDLKKVLRRLKTQILLLKDLGKN